MSLSILCAFMCVIKCNGHAIVGVCVVECAVKSISITVNDKSSLCLQIYPALHRHPARCCSFI